VFKPQLVGHTTAVSGFVPSSAQNRVSWSTFAIEKEMVSKAQISFKKCLNSKQRAQVIF